MRIYIGWIMRIWSIHPKYLDAKGLVALWRESLLAQNVLAGKTKGYKNHPQLNRFKDVENPMGAIAFYLKFIAQEADRRGYNFNKEKINGQNYQKKIKVTSGQIKYEFEHLLKKLEARDIKKYSENKQVESVDVHPLFEVVNGDIEAWEIFK